MRNFKIEREAMEYSLFNGQIGKQKERTSRGLLWRKYVEGKLSKKSSLRNY